MGTWGMGTPVEIEFAVNMNSKNGKKKEFGLLQLRPLVVSFEEEQLNIKDIERLTIQKALIKTNGNRSKAAELLGFSVRTLRNKLHEYQSEGILNEIE